MSGIFLFNKSTVMKKILLCSLMLATLTLVSCGDKTSSNGVLNDSVMSAMKTKLEENDADGFSAAITQTQQAIEKLIREGKFEEAQECARTMQEFIINNAETIKSVAGEDNELVNSIIETITNVPEGMDGSAEDLKEEAIDVANQIVEDAKQKANDAVEDAKQKVNDAFEDAKQKVNEAIEDAEQKANDAADQAVEDAKQMAADKLKEKLQH